MGRHTLSVLVENKPGVLARVAALFARRRYNIESLEVEPVKHVALSRMTITADIGHLRIDQVASQIDKLVNVLEVEELHPSGSSEQVRPVRIGPRAGDPLAEDPVTGDRPASAA